LDDLFASDESGTAPLAVFLGAFEGWLAHARKGGQLTRTNSADTYRQMWVVVMKWCLASDPVVHLDEITEGDLEAFIATRHGSASLGDDLSPRYVWRLLHLIDRVLGHRARQQGIAPNTAAATVLQSRPEWRYANAAMNDGLPDHLPSDLAKLLVSYLSQARPRPGGRSVAITWNQLRNRAAVALQLGAGLSPGDVRAALLGGVTVACLQTEHPQSARRPSPHGQATSFGTGSRSVKNWPSPARTSFPRREPESHGARLLNTRQSRKCWRRPAFPKK
jgi:hypothetical protein